MVYRWIFFDIETTGMSPEKDKVVEIGAYDPLKNRKFVTLVNPGVPIPKETTAIHTITDEMVEGAPLFKEAGQQFINFCEGDVALVAHNGAFFDFPFLETECIKANLILQKNWIFIDSLKWARKYRKDLPRHALQYLRKAYNIKENHAHRALDDVMTLKEVFLRMIDDLSVEQVVKLIGSESLHSQHSSREEILEFSLFS